MPLNTITNICKVSAMEAINALSKFLNKLIELDILPIQIEKNDQLKVILPEKDSSINLFIPITGSLPGYVFLLISESSALKLCDLLLCKKIGTTKKFEDMEISAISEIANIMVGNFLSTFSISLHLEKMIHKISIFDKDHINNLQQKIHSLLKEEEGNQLAKISFIFKHLDIEGKMAFIFNEKAILALV